jgi:hydrogenase maturation protein HypF
MAEHNLREPVIGAAFDGTGYGVDDAVWGGEFLLCRDSSFTRLAHLSYSEIVGGDSAARNAAQTAACLLIGAGIPVPPGLFAHTDMLRAAMQTTIGCVQSSSMGRLFDAVSAILGICAENSYEGRCAIMLQQCAELAKKSNLSPAAIGFSIIERDGMLLIGYDDILRSACASDQAGAFALGFHVAVAEMLRSVFHRLRSATGINAAALSGGVFQNALLLELCHDALVFDGFRVYMNHDAPPNDSGIALGQALIAGRMFQNGGMQDVYRGSDGDPRT